jgi:hypothetical protein
LFEKFFRHPVTILRNPASIVLYLPHNLWNMENNNWLNEDLLWDYADDLLAPDDKVKVDAYLRQHPEWQERLNAIMAEKRALFALPLELPRPNFADSVMAAWTAEQVRVHAADPAKRRDWIIYAIAGVFALFILAPIVTIVVAAMQVSPDALLPANTPIPDVTSIDWSMLLGNSMLHYATYLGLTFVLLRFVEKFVQHRNWKLATGY